MLKEQDAYFVHTTLKDISLTLLWLARLDLLIHHFPLPLWWCFPVSVFSNHQVHIALKEFIALKSRWRVNRGFRIAVLTANTISRETSSKKWWEEGADWSVEGPFLLRDQDELLFSCNYKFMLKPWPWWDGLNSEALMSLTLAIRPLFTYKIITTKGNGFTSKLQTGKEFCHVWNRSGFMSQNTPNLFLLQSWRMWERNRSRVWRTSKKIWVWFHIHVKSSV